MDGFINLNKERGPSSQGAVAALKRLLRVKAGHCGALDPLACGVLPVCLGKATRLSQYVMGQQKRYVAEVQLGVETDSYDAAGAVLSRQDASHISAQQLQALLPHYVGAIQQRPPAVSALKQGGEPLYKKQRRGEQVDVPLRPVRIYQLRLLEFRPGEHPVARLEVCCGQGAYIRSLAHDLGAELGCGAHLTFLQRSEVGAFRLENSYTVAQIAALAEQNDYSFLIPMQQAVAHLPAVTVADGQLWRVAHGNDTVWPEAEFDAAPALRIMNKAGALMAIGHGETAQQRQLLKIDKVLVDAADYDEQRPCTVCVVGNFDGLHLGHRALFEQAHQLQQQYGGHSAMVTFSPHPLELIKGAAPPQLTADSLKRKLLLESFGVERVVALTFDRHLMNSSPESFVNDIIIRRLQARQVVVGYNFTFAAHGAGTAPLLQQLCQEQGVGVTVVPQVSCEYGPISSTHIRRALADGDMQAVNTMLGYWFTLEGPVVYGNQLGRSFGFPTANVLVPDQQAVPPRGVYAARVIFQGESYDAVANFGVKPTIGGEIKPLIEAHLFDVDIDLYGHNIRVCLGRFLRPERRFASHDELIARISADSLEARDFLSAQPRESHIPRPISK